jgi:hypothetical protein
MKGYLSFVLAFLCLMLIIALLSIVQASTQYDFSRAIAAQRAYGVGMNAKEAITEGIRNGARTGFEAYDATHLLVACMHCPDHFCAIPPAPNFCNEELCSLCFREDGARKAAESGINDSLAALMVHGFDPDFNVSIIGGSPEVSLAPDLKRPGKYIPDSIRLRERMGISVACEKLGIWSETGIPAGMVVRYG